MNFLKCFSIFKKKKVNVLSFLLPTCAAPSAGSPTARPCAGPRRAAPSPGPPASARSSAGSAALRPDSSPPPAGPGAAAGRPAVPSGRTGRHLSNTERHSRTFPAEIELALLALIPSCDPKERRWNTASSSQTVRDEPQPDAASSLCEDCG